MYFSKRTSEKAIQKSVILKSLTKSKAKLKVLLLTISLRTPNLSDLLQVLCAEEQDTIQYSDSACSMHMTTKIEFLREYGFLQKVVLLLWEITQTVSSEVMVSSQMETSPFPMLLTLLVSKIILYMWPNSLMDIMTDDLSKCLI